VTDAKVVSLVHLGCARNLIDSELILARLAEQGLTVAGDPAHADVAVLNTCSFIGPAREESEGAIADLVERKRRGELEGVVVVGCLVQRYARALTGRFPDVDLFAEISDYSELASSVARLASGQQFPRYLEAGGLRAADNEGARMLSTPASYAYLRISHGCDHTCAFCAIPAIRGPHRSKPLAAVLDEARDLIAVGARELVLVAEDSTAWGREHATELPELVEALAELDGEHRVRVMYAYPNRFPWELTRLLRDHPRVAPYLDIPIQHAATPVLRAMGRAGSGDQVRRTLDRLLEEVPGLTLRTTLLVGFPGETDSDVEELCDLVREYRLGRMGAFVYSHEEGTPAAQLADVVDPETARARHAAVLAVRDEVLRANQTEWVGREVEVTVDEVRGGWVAGRTPMDAPEVDPLVLLAGCEAEVGERFFAEVEDVDADANLLATAPTDRARRPLA
jgi:ribosomal protein S12 methylthiotransferase